MGGKRLGAAPGGFGAGQPGHIATRVTLSPLNSGKDAAAQGRCGQSGLEAAHCRSSAITTRMTRTSWGLPPRPRAHCCDFCLFGVKSQE